MAFMSNIQWDGVVKPTFVPIDSVFKVKARYVLTGK